MPSDTLRISPDIQQKLEELSALPDAEAVAARLEGYSETVVAQILDALDQRQSDLAGQPDASGASEQYDAWDALRAQVQARRGYQAIDEAV
ncbi:MAG: hypothetical protein Q7S29_02475 [Candidatus Peribacter sp.]|nr:hypothetical protein [Candidatus Peribacter sp.]